MDSTSIPTKRGRKRGSGKDPVAPKKSRSKKNSGVAAEADVVTVKQEVVPVPPTSSSAPSSCSRVLVAMLEGSGNAYLEGCLYSGFCDASSVPKFIRRCFKRLEVILMGPDPADGRRISQVQLPQDYRQLGPGVDNIDLEAAADLGIAVCHVNDNGIEEAADTALGLILDLYRKINWFDKMSKEGKTFKNFESIRTAGGGPCVRIRGDTLGLLGLGRVGVAVALRAKVFGFHVIFYDPYLEDGVEKSYGLTRVYTLNDLLIQSDCLSVHCGLNSQTADIINQYSINHMRPGAFLVNVSSSKLVNETALAVGLREGRIQGAAINTFGYDLIDGPLRETPNITCIPNSAFISETSLAQLREAAAFEMRRGILDGVPGKLRYLVNGEYLSRAGMLSASASSPSPPPPPGIPPDFNGDYYAAAAYAAVVAAAASASMTSTDTGAA
ncbi:C-terminal-binding protein [Orchesella cincta]|uniref:C-terminal-binding protein n=1 Tax=Orchesella cincta TaxID=48709 RepID=A0A1D2MNY1_ORCCI|nr:C-terminal-binding protein [Orchesella cincta]